MFDAALALYLRSTLASVVNVAWDITAERAEPRRHLRMAANAERRIGMSKS
jgi:hypothetical protein